MSIRAFLSMQILYQKLLLSAIYIFMDVLYTLLIPFLYYPVAP
jgi:hypothetical protein